MLAVVVWTVTVAGALLLVVSGVDHLWRRRWFDAVLRTHRLPVPVRRAVSAGLGPAELIVGVTVLGLFLVGWALPVAAGLVAVCYLGFGGYLLFLLRFRRGVDCGCLPGAGQAGPFGVVRAVVVIAAAGAAAFLLLSPQWRWPVAAAAVVLLMAGTVAVVTRGSREGQQ